MPKIFVYWPSTDAMEECQAVAYAEDGVRVAQHVSSNVSWFRHDMGLKGNWKHELYQAKYPNGYELVEVIGKEAMQRHIDAGEIRDVSFRDHDEMKQLDEQLFEEVSAAVQTTIMQFIEGRVTTEADKRIYSIVAGKALVISGVTFMGAAMKMPPDEALAIGRELLEKFKGVAKSNAG